MSESHSLLGSVVDGIRKASPTQIVVAVVILLSTQWILKGVYRVFFHPLCSFPGPKLSAFSRLPRHHAVWTGNLMPYLIKLHAQYGEVVRVSPDELSFIHPDAWRDIYGHGSGHGKGSRGSLPPKDWPAYAKSFNGVATMHLTQDPHDHSSQRRIFKSAFSDRALKEQEPLFNKYIDQLVGNLRSALSEKPETKFDMVKNYNYTTFDVMGDLTFGEPLHMLDNSAYDPWVSAIFAAIKFGSKFTLLSNYPRAQRLITSLLPASLQKKRMEHHQHSADRVTKRLEKGRATAGTDIWTLILEQEEGKQLTRGQMDANAAFFMIAGTETTATLLSGLTYYLLQNHEKLEKLTTEIRSAFSDPNQLTMEGIASLPYTAACIKEGLRLYPSVPFGLPHRTPADGSTICGRFVPPHTIVSAPHYPMYVSPLNFKDPLDFVPERWMGDERYAGDRKAALQPFSNGARDCLGKNMANHEMRLILTKVLYNFDLELCPESEGWADQKVYILWEKHPLMVKLRDVRA